MISRRRSTPWIYRNSRLLIGAIAIVGAIITAYLTIVKLQNGEVGCIAGSEASTSSCNDVLNSRYGEVFGLPLSLFGFLAYTSMAGFSLIPLLMNSETSKTLKKDVDNLTWLFLLIGATAMAVFSGYLMYVLFTELKVPCVYCITSAIFSLSLLTLTIVGRDWEDVGQIWFTGIIVAIITIIATLVVFAQPAQITALPNENGQIPIPKATSQPQPPLGWEINTTSGPAEIALAEHLNSIGAKKYGAFWCPHCYEQKQLFGKEAFAKINYIECAEGGKNPQIQACTSAQIQSYPSWEINGEIYRGTQTLERLAEISNYQGPLDFKYALN